MIVSPIYPGSIYDSTSLTRMSRLDNKAPDSHDWDQCIAELIAMQEEIDVGKQFEAIADNGGPVIAGAPVFMKTSGAIAYADTFQQPIGLLKTGGADGLSYIVQYGSILTLLMEDWDAVAGTINGLTPGFKYYLSNTPGLLSEGVPDRRRKSHLFILGVALMSTKLLVQFDDKGLMA